MKKLLGELCISICMLLIMIPMNAKGEESKSINIADVTIDVNEAGNATRYWKSTADGFTESGAKASNYNLKYIPASSSSGNPTLVMKNVDYNEKMKEYAMSISANLDIVLEGKNTLTLTTSDNHDNLFGIFSTSDLNISGSGTLNILIVQGNKLTKEQIHGFLAHSLKIIDGCTVSIEIGNLETKIFEGGISVHGVSCAEYSDGDAITANKTELYVDNATLNVKAGTITYKDLVPRNNISCVVNGIYATELRVINNGNVNIVCGDMSTLSYPNDERMYSAASYSCCRTYTYIDGGSVYIEGGKLSSNYKYVTYAGIQLKEIINGSIIVKIDCDSKFETFSKDCLFDISFGDENKNWYIWRKSPNAEFIDSSTKPFGWYDFKSMYFEITKPMVLFTSKPSDKKELTEGSITDNDILSAEAGNNTHKAGNIKYSWYACDSNGKVSGKAVGSASSFKIPTSLGAGTYYYLCRAEMDGYESADSIATVVVQEKPTEKETETEDITKTTEEPTTNAPKETEENVISTDIENDILVQEDKSEKKGNKVLIVVILVIVVIASATAGTYIYITKYKNKSAIEHIEDNDVVNNEDGDKSVDIMNNEEENKDFQNNEDNK